MKAYHIAFTFDAPSPTTITLPADDQDAALAKLKEMTEGFNNVKVHEITDLETVPFLKALFEKQNEQAMEEMTNSVEPEKMN